MTANNQPGDKQPTGRQAETGRRRWRCGLRRLALVVLLCLIVWLGRHLYVSYTIRQRLREAIEEMDRDHPGWRLEEIEAARAVVPDDENGALCVLRAWRLLPPDWHGEEGKERWGFLSQLPATRPLDDVEVLRIEVALASAEAALPEALKLADRETGRYPIRYTRDGYLTPLPHLDQMRDVGHLLRIDSLLRLHNRDWQGAVRACRALVNVGRSVGDEPFAISQASRSAHVRIGCDIGERLLVQGEPPLQDLAALQRVLEKEAAYPLLEVSMRGERAIQHQWLGAMESGDVAIADGCGVELAKQPFEGWPIVGHWRFSLSRDDIRNQHPAMFPPANRLVEISRLPPHLRPGPQAKLDAELRSTKCVGTAGLWNLGRYEEYDRHRQARLRCLIAALAVERYRRSQGSWPASLGRMKQAPPASTLTDPCDGNPLRYRRLKDGVIIYSVGLDGYDDGGNLDELPGTTGTDIGIRLWEADKRSRPPTKRPAPKEEEP